MHEDEAAVLRRELPGRYAALSEEERRHGGRPVDELLAATGRLLELDRAAGDAVRGARTVVGVGAVVAVGSLALMPVVGGVALLAVNAVAGLLLVITAWPGAGIGAPVGARLGAPAWLRSGARPVSGAARLLSFAVLGLAALLALLVAIAATGVDVVVAVAVALTAAVAVLASRWWP